MSTFHCFPLLPLEMRERIWELAMEPRQIAYNEEPPSRWQCPPWPSSELPALLHACAESRTYLQRHYAKVFVSEKDPQKYAWVNFDIDTIYLSQYSLERLEAECPMVRKVIILGINSETFFHFYARHLRDMHHLEMVTILHMEGDEDWWRDWHSMMEIWYLTDYPVDFYARILCPKSPPYEINPYNYRKVERDARRKLLAEHPDWSDYEISDDDNEEYSVSGRFRTG